MYGITTMDGSRVLCKPFSKDYGPLVPVYVLKRWERNGILVMMDNPLTIDALMQEYMVASGNYNLKVFKFTEEQIERQIIARLRGY